jgi:hypothetical protein
LQLNGIVQQPASQMLSAAEADLVGPKIGPLHLNHKMAAAKIKA